MKNHFMLRSCVLVVLLLGGLGLAIAEADVLHEKQTKSAQAQKSEPVYSAEDVWARLVKLAEMRSKGFVIWVKVGNDI